MFSPQDSGWWVSRVLALNQPDQPTLIPQGSLRDFLDLVTPVTVFRLEPPVLNHAVSQKLQFQSQPLLYNVPLAFQWSWKRAHAGFSVSPFSGSQDENAILSYIRRYDGNSKCNWTLPLSFKSLIAILHP